MTLVTNIIPFDRYLSHGNSQDTQSSLFSLDHVLCFKFQILLPYLCNLCAPVEEDLGTNVGAVMLDVFQEAAKWHQLCDEHWEVSEAESDKTDTA